jgi:hypothetical protein
MSLYNLLRFEITCPRCGERCEAVAEFRFGLLENRTYRVGDVLQFDGIGEVVDKPGGHATVEGYAECNCCHKDYWVSIDIVADRITGVTVNPEKPPYIPDAPRTPDGKAMHWVENIGWTAEEPGLLTSPALRGAASGAAAVRPGNTVEHRPHVAVPGDRRERSRAGGSAAGNVADTKRIGPRPHGPDIADRHDSVLRPVSMRSHCRTTLETWQGNVAEVWYEFDGLTPVRRVTRVGERWLCSLDDHDPDVGPLLTDQLLQPGEFEDEEEIPRRSLSGPGRRPRRHAEH